MSNQDYQNAINPSVGRTNEPAPLHATEVAGLDEFGKLQPVLIDASGNLKTSVSGVVIGTFTPSGLTVKGVVTMVTIDHTAWYLAPPSPLILRNNIQVQNPSSSTSDVIWGYDNTQPLTTGIHIPPGASYSVAIRGSIPVYITLAATGSITVPVEELE